MLNPEPTPRDLIALANMLNPVLLREHIVAVEQSHARTATTAETPQARAVAADMANVAQHIAEHLQRDDIDGICADEVARKIALDVAFVMLNVPRSKHAEISARG